MLKMTISNGNNSGGDDNDDDDDENDVMRTMKRCAIYFVDFTHMSNVKSITSILFGKCYAR